MYLAWLAIKKTRIHYESEVYTTHVLFSHPDFTVGFGIAPNQPPKMLSGSRTITAGWELHPTPKNYIIAVICNVFGNSILISPIIVNRYLIFFEIVPILLVLYEKKMKE